MAKSTPLQLIGSIIARIFTVIGGAAAVAGIFYAGWRAAIVFGHADDRLLSTAITLQLTEKESELARKNVEIQRLEKQLADTEQQKNGLAAQLALVPADNDWGILTQRTLEFYGGVCKAYYPTHDRPTITNDELVKFQGAIARATSDFYVSLIATNILSFKEIGGTRWCYFRKNPLLFLNQTTGETHLGEPK